MRRETGMRQVSIALVVFVVVLLSLDTEVADARNADPSGGSLPTIPPISGDAFEKEMLWGTYRPNLYFGTKARVRRGIVTGMLWSIAGSADVRHFCEQGDGLSRYGWLEHDGKSYGHQEILDNGINITTTFVKPPIKPDGPRVEWVSRIRGDLAVKKSKVTHHEAVSLVFYVGTEGGSLTFKRGSKLGISGDFEISGTSPDLGAFTIVIKASGNEAPEYGEFEKGFKKQLPDLKRTHYVGKKMGERDLWKAREEVFQMLKSDVISRLQAVIMHARDKARRERTGFPELVLFPGLPNSQEPDSDLYAFQFIVMPGFKIDIAYVSHDAKASVSSKSLTDFVGPALDSILLKKSREFNQKFDNTFLTQLSTIKTPDRSGLSSFASAVFSNLIGGIGYFHGTTKVESDNQLGWSFTEDRTLYTAVPSRPFFPRGFLWDEGFHQTLIFHWDSRITIEVLRQWLNSMDQNGWIQREQILGDEARSKVPSEFQVQRPDIANPPTFFLVIRQIMNRIQALRSSGSSESEMKLYSDFLRAAYPRLREFYRYYFKTQQGVVPGTFRWRGRTENHTFASGLDDYPRARVPNNNEMHLDLLSWMAMSSDVMKRLAVFLQDEPNPDDRPTPADIADYTLKYTNLLQKLEEIHWDSETSLYCDVENYDVKNNRVLKFSKHIGYVSLFPMLLGLLPSDSPKLTKILDYIYDEQHLWSPYGVRSLSLSDPLYGKDENYWRGPIWININYLILASLHNHYIAPASTTTPSPNQEKASKLYNELRSNVISNLHKVYKDTGYIWEQYHPQTGQGQRSHPFTGWSALVVAMIAEKY
eukprot:TRINITY_DN4940_c0_g1_i2.p1 TRINITY_DN4940_c0_g1~~TRINITY_DN4940_c0_g1_i2.p1  ORF type:complete len:816 (-),score=189.00 TRINITY_DN4940_c0_g1_i2:35-2482(-)